METNICRDPTNEHLQRFNFSNLSCNSQGFLDVRIASADNGDISVTTNLVDTDASIPIGPKDLNEKMY